MGYPDNITLIFLLVLMTISLQLSQRMLDRSVLKLPYVQRVVAFPPSFCENQMFRAQSVYATCRDEHDVYFVYYISSNEGLATADVDTEYAHFLCR